MAMGSACACAQSPAVSQTSSVIGREFMRLSGHLYSVRLPVPPHQRSGRLQVGSMQLLLPGIMRVASQSPFVAQVSNMTACELIKLGGQPISTLPPEHQRSWMLHVGSVHEVEPQVVLVSETVQSSGEAQVSQSSQPLSDALQTWS